jgi:protein-L-isoaspartate(D-aspartate) O-methyltransferase
MLDFAHARRTMIENQLRTYDVLDYNTLEVMGVVPRELFVPKDSIAFAYLDRPVSLGQNRELMTPMVFGRLLQALDVKKTDRVLDIAGGTGYSAAVFASICDHVFALEDNAKLALEAEENFDKLALKNIEVCTGDIGSGLKNKAPFNVIFINGAVEVEPKELLDQLIDGGCLGCVFGAGRSGRAVIYRRNGSHFTSTRIFDAAVMTLSAFIKPKEFNF